MVLTFYREDAEQFAKMVNEDSKQRFGKVLAVTYTGDTTNTKQVLEQVDKGSIRILVVCGKLIEGYNQKKISICAILRKVAPKSKVST